MKAHEIRAAHSNMMFRNILTWAFLLSPLGLSSSVSAAEEAIAKSYVRAYTEQDERAQYDELLEQFGKNKQLPEGFELQALLALSHYPRLRDTNINFVVADVSIPLSSRPHWASMLRSAQNRTYQVIIDSQREGSREALLLKHQPFNAQVGIIGHELAHTAYYLDRSFFGIARDALCQLNDCRINFERATDRRLIDHGLGWQRYDHAMFVRGRIVGDSETASTLEGGGGAYMNPSEILRIMEGIEAYAD